MTVTTDRLPMLLCEVEVVAVERLSPSFVRVELGGPELADFGVDGPRYDQRIKLVFPDPLTGGLTTVAGRRRVVVVHAGSTGRSPSADTCAPTRSATSAASGADTTIVVDIVLHLDGDAVGPGSLWAARRRPGRPTRDDRAAARLPLRRHRVHARRRAPSC